MATTVLALLLGITMTVLAGSIWFVHKEYPVIMAALEAVENRVSIAEKRKAVIAEAVASQPKPAGVAGVRPRSWSELKTELEAQVD